MRLKKNLIPVVTLVSILFFIISYILFLSGVIDSITLITILAGGGIPFFNFITGYFSIRISLRQSDSLFLVIFLGGMLLRLFLMLLAVFLVLSFLEILAYSFIFIIFIFYSLYLISEIFYINQVKRS
jgi:hypothetical protein